MKIKEVCQRTGLSDRAIRFYIEQGLLLPQFTENYLGRRSYIFSQEDVNQLNNIAVLRKFGFTVAEIGMLIEDVANSKSIIAQLKGRKQAEIEENVQILEAINKLDTDIEYTVDELADKLSKASVDKSVPTEDNKVNKKSLFSKIIVYVFLGLTGLCYLFSVFSKIYDFFSKEYPYFPIKGYYIVIASLIPVLFFLLLIVVKHKSPMKIWLHITMLIVCALLAPLCTICTAVIPVWSQTEEIKNYKKFDPGTFSSEPFVSEVFPHISESFEYKNPGSFLKDYKEANYFYRDVTYLLTMCNDVYLEWQLEKDDFDSEVERVINYYKSSWSGEYITVRKGDYICLLKSKNDKFEMSGGDSYYGYLFAYNSKTLTVRYACSDGTYWNVDPYISELEW